MRVARASSAARRRSLDALKDLNAYEMKEVGDPETLTRISQYELAFRMQMAVPDVMDVRQEPAAVLEEYGARPGAAAFANNCLLARRLVERGVRYVQLFDWGWDCHGTGKGDDIVYHLPEKCRDIDRPVAAQERRSAAGLVHRRAAELAAPDHDRLVEQALALQVLDQGCNRPVDLLALLGEVVDDVVPLAGAVAVPAPVEELDIAHAPLDKPAGEQAVVRKRGRARLGAIHLEDALGFLADVHHVGHRHLHPEGQLVLADPGQGLGVAELLQLVLVELAERIECAAAISAIHSFRIAHIQDRVADRPALDALVDAGQEARAPEGLAAGRVRAAADQHDEARQVLILRSQTVGNPRAHRRAAVARGAGEDVKLGGRVVELIGMHRSDDGDVVGDLAHAGQELADRLPALAALLEPVRRSQELGMPLDEREPLVLEQLVGAGLHVVLDQRGLVIEQVLLGRCT